MEKRQLLEESRRVWFETNGVILLQRAVVRGIKKSQEVRKSAVWRVAKSALMVWKMRTCCKNSMLWRVQVESEKTYVYHCTRLWWQNNWYLLPCCGFIAAVILRDELTNQKAVVDSRKSPCVLLCLPSASTLSKKMHTGKEDARSISCKDYVNYGFLTGMNTMSNI